MYEHSYNRGAQYDGKPKRPYPWGSKVTICIAATCNHSRDGGPKIVLCTDWQQSSLIGNAETLHKQQWLPNRWVCLTAGETTEINAVVKLMRKRFRDEEEIDETNVVPLVQETLRARLLEKRDEYSYGQFSRSYNDIMNTGRNILPPDVFVEFTQKTKAIEIEAEFIVAGYVGSDDFLLETTKTGNVRLPTDFSCIGEGGYLAQASLLQRDYIDVRDFGAALYEVYEAKKHAERVNSVGKNTLLRVLNENGTIDDVKGEKLEYFERLYRNYGPKTVPILMDVPDDLFT